MVVLLRSVVLQEGRNRLVPINGSTLRVLQMPAFFHRAPTAIIKAFRFPFPGRLFRAMPEETFFCGERHLSLEPPIELELFVAEVQIKIPPAIFQLVSFAPLSLSPAVSLFAASDRCCAAENYTLPPTDRQRQGDLVPSSANGVVVFHSMPD